jgi:hypothetical protein
MIEIRQNGSSKPPIDEGTIITLFIMFAIFVITLINRGLH